MTDRQQQQLVSAFKSGNMHLVEQLLTSIRPVVVSSLRTQFPSLTVHGKVIKAVAMVSLLHLAAYWGWKDIAVCLVAVHNCSPMWKDEEGQVSLHYAACEGHLEVVKYFTAELHCDPMDRNKNNTTPLHYACIAGHLNIVHYLIREAHCNPSCVNKNGITPVHGACRNGRLNLAQYLINEVHCNPSCVNNVGDTPLHTACRNGHLNIVQYLIGEAHCNPSCVDIIGWTPLHTACDGSHTHIVQYLLSTGHVDPMAKSKYSDTPLSYATGKYDIIKLFQPFIDCSRDFPIHMITKLILTGDSGAGKTTIAQLIKLLANRTSSSVAVDCVADVQRFTAGIIPHHIESELGNFVMYDFAGQQEYYSSHAAVLEQVMRESAAMFICMIDLSKGIDSISQSLHYWLTFINNACSTTKETSHVAIIGSHADQVTLKDVKEKSSVLKAIAASRVKHQKSLGYVAMDCRHADTDGSQELISILSNSHKAITANQPSISYYCHVLYAFLRTKLEHVGIKLDDLVSAIAKENDSSLPKDSSVLTELLTTLSDKGLILFIQHSQPKWVAVKTEVLLHEINGELFSPHSLKVYPDLASSTGVIPASSLHKVFDQYDKEMLVGFLVSLDFCRPVDPSVLQYTNLQIPPPHSTADLLFFPGLVQSERPDSLTLHGTLQFGWCLGCVDRNEFFGSHFLHLLLLSVAHRFPLADSYAHSCRGPQQRCTVWKNGISWSNSDSITTVIEFIDKNRWVLVAMLCCEDRPVEFSKLRSELISLVRHLQEDRCQSLEVCECLISPSLIQMYPFDDLPDTNLFDIRDVAMSILHRKPLICSQNKQCKGYLSAQSLLPFEPYHLISPSYVCQLFNSDMADQPVPAPHLQEVRKHFHLLGKNPLVYKELRGQMDKLSIFAGRNPLELAGLKEEDLSSDASYSHDSGSGDRSSILSTADLKSDVQTHIVEQKEEDHIHSPTAGAGSGDHSSILSIDDLAEIIMALKNFNDWLPLGLQLGLRYDTLKRIEKEQHGHIDECKTEMLVAWLKRKDNVAVTGVPCCAVLKAALKKLDENQLASEINNLEIEGRSPKLSSIVTHGSNWWIIVLLVIPVLLAVIVYLLC